MTKFLLGAGGGSEQWEHHIGQWVSDQYFRDNGFPAPPAELEQLLGVFRPQKARDAESRFEINIRLHKPDDIGVWRSTLTLNAIDQAWIEAIGEPLRTARCVISRLRKHVEQGVVSTPLVVVSGGTARNPAVKSYMTALCDTKRVPVVFTDDFDVTIVHASVAPSLIS